MFRCFRVSLGVKFEVEEGVEYGNFQGLNAC